MLVSWSSEGTPKAKGSTPDVSKTIAHLFSLPTGSTDGGRGMLPSARQAHMESMQPPHSHTPTLNVLREFFISATFSSMAQRQLLTFSSRAYSPCWMRDSSCIASVKPAFSSEANACNYSNHKQLGSVSPPRLRCLCPRGSQRLGVTHPVRCCPLSPPPFMAGKHGEVWPLLQPRYRVGGVCLGQSMCPFFRLFLKTFLSFSRLPGSLQPVSL